MSIKNNKKQKQAIFKLFIILKIFFLGTLWNSPIFQVLRMSALSLSQIEN